METPYRNMQLLKDVIQTLSNETYFTIAASLTLNNELVRTQTIEKWKKSLPEINKKPAIFILQAYNLLT
jgi:16S rRNA (cytidine1402-2'-O)-methyltransferase